MEVWVRLDASIDGYENEADELAALKFMLNDNLDSAAVTVKVLSMQTTPTKSELLMLHEMLLDAFGGNEKLTPVLNRIEALIAGAQA